MPEPQQLENEVWRVLLFAHEGSELLLLRSPSGFRLPELHIPRWQRTAPNLNAEVKRLWKLDALSLFPMEVELADGVARQHRYHVMELCHPEELARVAPDFLIISVLQEASFAHRRDFLAVRQAMRFDGASFPDTHKGPFSEFGSFQKICAWVQTQLRSFDLQWDGCFRQLQAGGSFALIRFQTQRGGVWFKAVGAPNAREYAVTQELTIRFPQYVPVCIASCAEWNAWLTEEVRGQDLFNWTKAAEWCRAAESLAEMQVASIPQVFDILAVGAHDVRSNRLSELATPFFQVVEQLMEQQTKPVPPPLDKDEIGDLRQQVISMLERTDCLHIPDTLNHLDPNPGNIFVSEEKCTFLDWAEAGVGNPFLTFEYLRQHFRSAIPGGAEVELCNSYVKRWTAIVPSEITEEMIRLAPLMALFTHAVSNDTWRNWRKLENPDVAGYFRSLVRQMKRYADSFRAAVPVDAEVSK